MTKGIRIRICRRIETRRSRPREAGIRVWTGAQWVRPDSLPDSNKLAYIFGRKPRVVKTVLEFPPSGMTPDHAGFLRRKLERALPSVRAGCAANANFKHHNWHGDLKANQG